MSDEGLGGDDDTFPDDPQNFFNMLNQMAAGGGFGGGAGAGGAGAGAGGGGQQQCAQQ